MNARRLRLALVPAIAALVLGFALERWYARPRPLAFPDYGLDVALPRSVASRPATPLRIGASTVDITPDPASSANPVWLAGFHRGRRATGVHDPISARALVLDDGRVRLGLIALDLIGLHHDETVRIRSALPAALGLDYVVVTCLHNHEGPDTMGLWGPDAVRTGVDPVYLARVRAASVEAAMRAVADLGAASLVVAERDLAQDRWIRDSRPPEVIDARLLALGFDGADGRRRATLVLWSNHPEAVGDENSLLSSDFPHYVREEVESRAGGTCLYLSGSVGGLMTPLEQVIAGPDGREHRENGFDKAEALGRSVGRRAVEALGAAGGSRVLVAPLAARARLVDLEADNRLFWAAMKLRVIDRGLVPPSSVRTEVGALRIGPVALALVPGELYPEIAVGGIECPEGADLPGIPAERPPIRALLGSIAGTEGLVGVVGLANDEIGYIIPGTQWDRSAPFTYGQTRAPYGEVNSVGPAAGPQIHRALAGVIAELPR